MTQAMQSLADFKRFAKPALVFCRHFPGADTKSRIVTVADCKATRSSFRPAIATADELARSQQIPRVMAPGSIFRRRRVAASKTAK